MCGMHRAWQATAPRFPVLIRHWISMGVYGKPVLVLILILCKQKMCTNNKPKISLACGMFLYFLFRLFYPPKWIVRTLAFISVWNCALRPVSLLMSPDMWTMIHSKSIRNECESCVFLLLLLRRPDIPSPTLKANTECASRRAHTHTHAAIVPT